MDTDNKENQDFSESSSGYAEILDPNSEYGDGFRCSDEVENTTCMVDDLSLSINMETCAVVVAPSIIQVASEADAEAPPTQAKKDNSNGQEMTVEEELYQLKQENAKLREENNNLRAWAVVHESKCKE